MISIRRLGAIGRTYRHLNRYQRIIRILFKYGFDDLVEGLRIDQYLETGLKMINRKPREEIEKHSRPERFRMALEELGPTFIKLGQVLSTRPDLIPPRYLYEFAKLQDNVPPFTFAEVEEIFLAETGKKPNELFQEFSEKPMAAASIGQVHRGRLQDGKEVVIKVQRPNIENVIAVDLEILAHLASLMEQYLEELQGHRPSAVVDEFARSLSLEIDYMVEVANIQRFAQQFKSNKNIYVPLVYADLSTERILTMEYVDGIKTSKVDVLRSKGYDLQLIAERGADLVMEQIFVHGFFHGDPHPGNIFILPDNVICFLDFGMMGRLSRQDREDFTDLMFSIVMKNDRRITDGVLSITTQFGKVDHDALSRDLGDLLGRYMYLPLKDLQAGKILQELLELVQRHKLSIKPNLYLMIKALSTIEGLGLMLHPDLELITLAEPYIKKVKAERMRLGRLAEEISETGGEYLEFIREVPEEVRGILRQLRAGRMKIEFEHLGVGKLSKSLDQVSNRIAFAIVLAAQIIGSSLIILSDIPPKWKGIPVIGLAGFLVAGVMGFWLLLSIIRHNRM
ncbi:MAG: AarF/ABC1/UbiB kinase family protein [Proteobacteria bacterium]|nr:AarF/ABC1/UbiB kinase family protein [Pseudomonadota bacterium]MBU1234443.1 AarF/ABC1/UbiB kinase family protein [Pseudomonadota bacterium]MBU1418104.1 AarF/ABC1/UbiB kinase family protein [Pseudomonadota bacterium]MBU1453300.1 AarF/ABC1/UbiB kinase family protein [Pseudomonadota bacterium]